jgi:hypothetical protein
MPTVLFAVVVESNLVALEKTLLPHLLVNFSNVLSHQDCLTPDYIPLHSQVCTLPLHNDLEAIGYTLS